MRSRVHRQGQGGFALLSAIFILVVLSALGAYMVTISGVQQRTTLFALQGARAYQAAQGGIEWGIYRVLQASSCAATTPFSVEGFNVEVGCQALPNNVYRITSKAESGTYGSGDYVSRRLEAKVDGS